ncbi:MAG: 2-isopropylmalate synthase [Hadesarchaea archaeon]|nr:2-isopropylmalate synthase [Hadesarchaea archaeon]
MAKRIVRVLDTTLRDGEQTPGVALNPDEKLEIAKALDDLGVDTIEAGAAVVSEGEREAIKRISKEGLKAEICSYVRALKGDIDAALDCDVDSVHLVVPTSDLHLKYRLKKTREQLKEMAIETSLYALDHGLVVELSAEDATRTDPEFLREVLQAGANEGVQRVCICDTVGIATPEQIGELFSYITGALEVPVAAHCHNDFGLATANTLAAVKAGAGEVHVTINGLGERAGNAALEEVILALSKFYGIKTGIKLEKLYQVSQLVERYTEVPVPPNKAVVGTNAFSHEAGIHTHGVLVHPSTYEPIPPETVGQRRRLVFGKHVGSHAIESELRRRGIEPTREQVQEIFRRIKRLGDRGKLVTDAEWSAIVDEVVGEKLEEMIKLDELTVTSGNKVTPTASVRLKFEGKELTGAAVGVGPVDAAINAIRKVVEGVSSIKLQEYHVDAISGGTDAMVSVVVRLTDGRRIVTARGTSSDIIMASVLAVLNGSNRLLWDKKLGRGQ